MELRADLISFLFGIALVGIVLLGLKNTSYALNGVNGDAGFQTAQVTKFAAYSRSVDFAYKDLPAFYPPLYFYILGRIAALLNIEPYRMMKYGLVTIVYILPFLTRKFWSFVLPSIASIAVVLSVFFFQDWYKPSEWLSLFLFLPWWLYFIENLGLQNKTHGLLWYATGGLIGALIFTTYYYWFFIGGLSLLFHFVFQRMTWERAHHSSRALWLQRLGILSSAAFFSLPYWGPYLVSMWRTGGWAPLQNRYFIENFTLLEFPFFALSITGILLLLGFAYLLKNYKLKPLPIF